MTIVLFLLVGGACLEAAVARVVDVEQVRLGRDDLATGRQVRTAHVLHERARLRIGLIQQVNAGLRHLAKVMRRYVGGHAHCDTLRAVQQDVRQARRQEGGLLERAVEVRLPVHGAIGKFAQQHLGVPREFRFRVAHRREGFRVVDRAPIALPIDDGIAITEILRHQHHRLVTGGIAVRMEFADHVTDGARGFLVLLPGREAELAHRIDDAALHRLQSVGQARQRAVEDDVHRIVEVRLLGEGAQRLLLYAFEIEFVLHGGNASRRVGDS